MHIIAGLQGIGYIAEGSLGNTKPDAVVYTEVMARGHPPVMEGCRVSRALGGEQLSHVFPASQLQRNSSRPG
jgi:hypothetical protein